MKTIIVIAIFAALLAVAHADWKLVWADEFDGDELDLSKWTHETGNDGWGNNELENYTKDQKNSYLQDGNLIIEAIQEDDGSYTSARLNTQGKFDTSFGKFEMRAKLPFGKGMWPAFWLLGTGSDYPACGEIDIMENIGSEPNVVEGSTHGEGFDTSSDYSDDDGFVDDYHTYAAIWSPGQIEFLVDNNVYTTVTSDDVGNEGGYWPFDDVSMYIILNLAVGGDMPGSPDASTHFPQQYVIDYVRVYQEW